MANRYAEDIRRIAGVDNLAGGIGSQPAKQPIQGGRGIAYFNADGTIGSESGTKGETTPPEDAADGNAVTDGDGNTGDDITHEPVSDSGVVPVEDLFNGNMGIGDNFTGVNGLQDCSTGQEYEVRGDGQFNAPEGWEDANTPPIDPTYTEGEYWGCAGYKAATAQGACQLWYEGDSWEGTSDSVFFDGSNCVLTDAPQIYQPATQIDCGGSGQSYCNPTPEDIYLEDEWPAEMPAQITWDSDKSAFISSQFDGKVGSEYKANNSGQITLCDSSGNQYTVVPSKDGGLVFTDVTNNIFIVRNSAGKITAAGTGSNRDQYVAK